MKNNLRHPLKNVKGEGASGDAVNHWWLQRLTALALVPLTLWFVLSIIHQVSQEQSAVMQWVSRPWVTVALVLYLATMYLHAQLGVQVVIEDYISSESRRLITILLCKAILLIATVAAVLSVLRIAL